MTPEVENLSKKRRLEEALDGDEGTFVKRSKAEFMNSVFDTELHLESPLPSEWQRCLDLQSGQIHFYNTRTHTRISKDPRRSPEPTSSSHLSLDLELNLPCDSLRKVTVGSVDKRMNSSGGLMLAAKEEEEEMVATVCSRCHMLVMLIKSSPACPNCKFMHPPAPGPPKLFKQRLSLLC
ncbi:hypothetical protein V6N13_065554 [Hibiscus sabdariffa]|uniref:WW domain-containing protein n=1 Tax=Hibiscus sabdariffa TaxID=183260 RepID=A0ABR2QQI2_9ROSI